MINLQKYWSNIDIKILNYLREFHPHNQINLRKIINKYIVYYSDKTTLITSPYIIFHQK